MSSNFNKSISETACRVGEVRFSYPVVFVPKEDDDGKKKYSVCLLVPKTDKKAIALLEEKIEAAKQLGKTTKWNGKIPANLRTPLRDGDDEKPDKEEYQGMMFFNASNTHKPQVQVIDMELGSRCDATPDSDDFYAGCYGVAVVNFFPYDTKGGKGVAASLQLVAKTRDGERFSGGGISADDALGDLC